MDDIEALKTPFLFKAIKLYNEYNTFEVLPHGQGTLAEKPTVIEIIQIFKQEENAWDAWEREKHSK